MQTARNFLDVLDERRREIERSSQEITWIKGATGIQPELSLDELATGSRSAEYRQNRGDLFLQDEVSAGRVDTCYFERHAVLHLYMYLPYLCQVRALCGT